MESAINPVFAQNGEAKAQNLSVQAQDYDAQSAEHSTFPHNQAPFIPKAPEEPAAISAQNTAQQGTSGFARQNDILLRELAKYRLAKKRDLIWQLFDVALIGLSMFYLWVQYDYFDRSVYGWILFLFWAFRFIIRIAIHVKPTMKNGIRDYFRKRKEEKLGREYELLKQIHGDPQGGRAE